MAVTSTEQYRRAAVCRITEGRERWRVVVESWEEQGACRGRLLFVAEDTAARERQSAPLLAGDTHEDVLAHAHDVGEEQLRRLLNSL